MSKSRNSASSGGIGFLGLLTILFIGLKLTNYIDWEWKWVLAPMWIPLCISLVVILLALLMAAVTGQFGRRK